jgi:ABC-type uncharacterized transport system permease subunit
VIADTTTTTAPEAAPAPRPVSRTLLLTVGAIAVLSLVRVIADADDLTSVGTFASALRGTVPILLAGLGGLFAERCGVVNIGLEGMMILGTWFGAYGATEWGAWEGVAFAVVGGALGGLLHAVATVTFGVDHVVSGVAINILGAGVARYLSVIAWVGKGTGGGATQSPTISDKIGDVDLPLLAGGFGTPDVLGRIASWRWFVVSDVAAVLRALTGGLSQLTVLALLLVPASAFFLWRTRTGLRLRSAGENPHAAESLGVDVYRMKYIGVVVSGAFAGLAGAFLVIESTNIYREGQTGGRGFIGLASVIFGNWRPTGVAAGAGLFGFADALGQRDEGAVHALLLAIALAVGAIALVQLYRRRAVAGAAFAAVAIGFAWWYLASDEVPREFLRVTPHVVTLLVLAFATQRLRPPAADGLRYRKGET